MGYSVLRDRYLRRGTKASMEANLYRVRRMPHEAEVWRRLQYNPPPLTDIDVPGLMQDVVTFAAVNQIKMLIKTYSYD